MRAPSLTYGADENASRAPSNNSASRTPWRPRRKNTTTKNFADPNEADAEAAWSGSEPSPGTEQIIVVFATLPAWNSPTAATGTEPGPSVAERRAPGPLASRARRAVSVPPKDADAADHDGRAGSERREQPRCGTGTTLVEQH